MVQAAHRIAAQVAVLAGAEFEERVVARFLREWTEGTCPFFFDGWIATQLIMEPKSKSKKDLRTCLHSWL